LHNAGLGVTQDPCFHHARPQPFPNKAPYSPIIDPLAYDLLQLGPVTIHVKRDTQLSIAYSEELISSTISATLQSTDRHHGIVGQERCHFQRDS
jgi:hypothetical protein